jgi:RNA polymerase sigma-70 factor (ECF subfamily)
MMMAAPMSFPRASGHPQTRPSQPPFDPAALERCRKQDPIAFRAFVVRHERMVFGLLSRMLGHGSEVEDLAQETFVRAYRAFPSFDPNGAAKVSTWLLTIAVRLALDSRKKRRATSDVDVDLVESHVTPQSMLEQKRLGDALSAAAMQLPDDQRAALLLSEMHGLSVLEIATALEIPENTVKTRLFRAREKMRALLTEWRPS